MTNTIWKIDSTQSETTFKIRKLMITTIDGNFRAFAGQVESESEKFELLKNIIFKANVDSIKTDDEKRDEHLRSADFFDADAYPYFSFETSSFNTKDVEIHGELTIRDISKPVTLDAQYLGTSINNKGDTSAN